MITFSSLRGWRLVVLSIYLCLPTLLTAQDKERFLELDFKGGIAFVEFTVNGQPARFLLDTGSSISILDEAQAAAFSFEYFPERGRGNIHGLGGTSSFHAASPVKLHHKQGLQFSHCFYATDLSSVQQFLKPKNLQILGILGADFFLRHRATIDYGTKRLALR